MKEDEVKKTEPIKNKSKVKMATGYIVLLALFTALTCVATIVIVIPIPMGGGTGYVNIGDSIIFIGSIVLGPVAGAFIGGAGSCLADLLLGYAVYAPFTLVIKGLEGFICGFVYRYLLRVMRPILKRLFAMLLGGIVMIGGYFVTEVILVNIFAALPTLIFSSIQIVAGMAIALIVTPKIPTLFNRENFINKKE